MPVNLTGTNMAMRAQMVGVPQRIGVTKKAQKQQEAHITQEPKKQTKAKKQQDSFQRSSQAKRSHQRKAQQVIRRFVATTGHARKSQKAQKKNIQQTQTARHSQEQQQQQAKVPLDNASRIGLMYQQAMRNKKKAKGKVQNDNNAQTHHKQLKRFLANLRQYVNLEYKQYTKSELSLYSRRNLREILSALGHQTKAFDNKAAKERRRQQTGGVSRRYNKHYAARASKSLKLFNEDPMQDPSYDPFEMIA